MQGINLTNMTYKELKELRKMVREEIYKKMNIEDIVEPHDIKIDGMEILIDDFPLRNIADGGIKVIYDDKSKNLELTIIFAGIKSFNIINYNS